MFRATQTLLAVLFSIALCVVVTGCPQPGPGERAGERLDEAVEEVEEDIEEAGDRI